MAAEDDQDNGAGNGSPDDGGQPAGRVSNAAGRVAGLDGGDAAGWVLGLFLWAGIALPFIQKGPAGVKAWWLAKFFNKAPDGSWLP